MSLVKLPGENSVTNDILPVEGYKTGAVLKQKSIRSDRVYSEAEGLAAWINTCILGRPACRNEVKIKIFDRSGDKYEVYV